MKQLILFSLYNLLTLLLLPFFTIFIAGTWLSKPVYRNNMAQRFGRYPSDFFRSFQNKTVFWVHAASVGEVMMSRLFIRTLKNRYPEARLILSTITPTGQAAAVEHLQQDIDLFIYFPFDFFWIAPSLVKKISPTLFIFLETEIWPNCLKSLSARNIPTIMVNGRISVKSLSQYKKFLPFWSCVLNHVSLFLMQSAQDAQRIIALGAPPHRVEETGNMKYDQAGSGDDTIVSDLKGKENLGLSEGDLLMIAGSTRPGEEKQVLDAYEQLLIPIPCLTLVIAPRHLERLVEVEILLEERGHPAIRKRKIKGPLRTDASKSSPVVLLDTLGELSRLYALGQFIFVGGSLASFGGHNPLEAAAWEKPVFFGPHMENFQEISHQLLTSGGGIEVKNGRTLGEKILHLSQHPEEYQQRATSALQVVQSHQGAVKKNIDRIAEQMEPH